MGHDLVWSVLGMLISLPIVFLIYRFYWWPRTMLTCFQVIEFLRNSNLPVAEKRSELEKMNFLLKIL